MAIFEFFSERGDILPLSNNKYFTLSHIDGQTVAEANTATVTTSGADGDTINNMQTLARIIIIDMRIKSGIDVEEAKREILRVVKYKKNGGIRWTQNGRTVVIRGRVEKVELPRWEAGVTMQITLHCEQPFWEDVDAVIQQINEAIGLHYFSTSPYEMLYFPEEGIPLGRYDTIREKMFYNNGDVAVGVEITIIAHNTVTNPIIYDQNGDFFGLGYEYESADGSAGIGTAIVNKPFIMQAGDNVVITTHKGNKTVKHNGVVVLDKIKPNSTWLQLETGDNAFRIDSDDESVSNMSFSINYKQRYI